MHPTLTIVLPWRVFLKQINNTALNFAELTSIIRHLRNNIVAQHGTEFYNRLHRIAKPIEIASNRETGVSSYPPPKKNNNNEMFIKLQGTEHRENSFAVPIINLSDQVVTDNVLLTLNLLFVRPILFANAEIFEGPMIQQWSINLNKQVDSFVPKLFPSGTPKP